MSGLATAYSSRSLSAHPKSRAVAILIRIPLVALTLILALIAFRYLLNPVEAASSVGVAFTSPGGITVARVGFGAFPLGFVAFFLNSLLSQRQLLPGLRTELALLAIVIAVRILGMVGAHSAETGLLLIPEVVIAALCVLAMRLETNRQKREQATAV